MSQERQILQKLRTLVGNPNVRPNQIIGTVTVVDEGKATCSVDPLDDSELLEGVMLQPVASSGVLIIPTVGSVVIATMLNKVTAFVSMYSQVDKIVYLDGSFNGLVKVKELTDKINKLEKDLNAIKKVFSTTWVVAPNDGGAALKAAAATWAGQTLAVTPQSDIENDKIKHGK